jgi:hypothetical protein
MQSVNKTRVCRSPFSLAYDVSLKVKGEFGFGDEGLVSTVFLATLLGVARRVVHERTEQWYVVVCP